MSRGPSLRSALLVSIFTLAIAALAINPGTARAIELNSSAGRQSTTFAYGAAMKRWATAENMNAQTVHDRSRNWLQPEGVRIGNYLVFADVEARTVIDDNIFATAGNRTADQNLQLLPNLKFQSQFSRHVMNFEIGGKVSRYARNTELNHENVYGLFDGALHINHAHTLSLSLLSAIEHEDRLSGSAPSKASELTRIWHNRANVGLTRDAGRLHATLSGAYESWDFRDVEAFGGGVIDQDYRDLKIFSSDLKIGYRFSPGFSLETKLRGLRKLHGGTASQAADAWGYEATAGLNFETSPLLKWQIIGGYGIRDYDRPDLKNTAIGLLQGRVTWLPTQLLTIYGTASRKFDDAVFENAIGGKTDNTIEVSANYEALRNLIFTITGKYTKSDYVESARKDNIMAAGLRMTYMHTKNWNFTAGYEYAQRTSNTYDGDISRNRFIFSAKLRF